MADNVIDTFDVRPHYASGFEFYWTISPTVDSAGPWEFTVQRSETPYGPWENLSNDLTDVYFWQQGTRTIVPKTRSLYFRVKANIGGVEHVSPAKGATGDVNRREFLIIRDVQRNELLHMRQMSGVEVDIHIKSLFGAPCSECIDIRRKRQG
jgi:hypothetical protein